MLHLLNFISRPIYENVLDIAEIRYLMFAVRSLRLSAANMLLSVIIQAINH